MKKLFNILGLSREAILFDSKLFIFKAILAIATGYMVGKGLPLTRLDMISVLLGVMYNLEPINILGVKGGISQLIASTLGAACTGILILLFGINVATISISMALTLFVSLKINWRMVSPVAIFTCIYMTQYAQLDAAGNPSVWLTFRLRIAALGLGVLIAIFYNYIFSFFYYKKIAHKRLEFAKNQLLSGMEYTQRQLEGLDNEQSAEYITLFPSIFNDLDLVYTNISLMIGETKYSFGMLESEKLKTMQKLLRYFRDINHLTYDINFVACRGAKDNKFNEESLKSIKYSINALKEIDFTFSDYNIDFIEIEKSDINEDENRIDSNIQSIRGYVQLVLEEAKKL